MNKQLKLHLGKRMDWVLLGMMNWMLPDSFERSSINALSIEQVLQRTVIKNSSEPLSFTQDREYRFNIESLDDQFQTRFYFRPALSKSAPLLLFHHGMNEYPYDLFARRIFRPRQQFPFHIGYIQAPFHNYKFEPIPKGFQSINTVYQMLSGSIRAMEFVHQQVGTELTVAGISWGGVTSLLYQGLIGNAEMVIPMIASPNVAQVIRDAAHIFHRPIQLPDEQLNHFLDFTPFYNETDQEKIFPLLAKQDLLFPAETHRLFYQQPVSQIEDSHLTACFNAPRLRSHILDSIRQHTH